MKDFVKPSLNHEFSRLATKVAFYYHEIGMSQQEICNLLVLSQARVSRLLSLAQSNGIVKTFVDPPEGIHIELERKIEEAYGLLDVVIYDDKIKSKHKTSIAQEAAIYLEATLTADDVVGISSWSATLLETVEEMKARPHKVVKKVIQLIGGMGKKGAEIQASRLASRFAEVLSAEPVYLDAPGVVSNSEDFNKFKKEVSRVSNLWDSVTCAITGIGPLPQSKLLQESGNSLDQGSLNELLEKGAVGEVCLRFYDSWGNHLQSKFEDSVISISEEKLKKVPRRLAIAVGEHKIKAIKGALQGKWINVLITDLSTAEKLIS